jgi:hypothetical protein
MYSHCIIGNTRYGPTTNPASQYEHAYSHRFLTAFTVFRAYFFWVFRFRYLHIETKQLQRIEPISFQHRSHTFYFYDTWFRYEKKYVQRYRLNR